MATRLGVDVGGTFTDLIFYDDETRGRACRQGADDTRGSAGRRSGGDRSRGARTEPRRRALLPPRDDGGAQLAAHTKRRGRRSAHDARVPGRARAGARRPRRSLQPVLAPAGAPRAAAAEAAGDGADPWRRRGARAARRGRCACRARDLPAGGRHLGCGCLPERLCEPGPRARSRGGTPERRLRRSDLALPSSVGRVPRVRANVDRGDRRLRPASDDAVPAGSRDPSPRGGLRRHGDRDALRRGSDDLRRGRESSVRDDHVGAGCGRRGCRRARPSPRPRRRDHRGCGRDELRHLSRLGRPGTADVRRVGRGDAGADRMGRRALDRRRRWLARAGRRRRLAEGRPRQRRRPPGAGLLRPGRHPGDGHRRGLQPRPARRGQARERDQPRRGRGRGRARAPRCRARFHRRADGAAGS